MTFRHVDRKPNPRPVIGAGDLVRVPRGNGYYDDATVIETRFNGRRAKVMDSAAFTWWVDADVLELR